jgi:AcrR family transcriptional regulator
MQSTRKARKRRSESLTDARVGELRRSRSDFTKNQIVEVAVRLFNERGVNEVPVQAVADAVGMSLGNLQYHFKTKGHIIRAIQPRMEAEIHAALAPPQGPWTPPAAAKYHVTVLKALWKYRFFFNALPHLLGCDPVLRANYERFDAKVQIDLKKAFDALIRNGQMAKVVKPNSTALIASNLWACLNSWLKFEQVRNPSHALPEKEALIDAALKNLSLLQLYFPPKFTAHTMKYVRALAAEQGGKH